jgi:1-deoxy-D-xylulose-5-phosphate reductoisomerase
VGLKRLAILGSTGSIGANALDVIERFPGRYRVVSLAAARSIDLLAEQAHRHRPEIIAVLNAEVAAELKKVLPRELKTQVVFGPEGYAAAAIESGAEVVVSAMVGAAGLLPTYAAVSKGLTIALANKESLVAGGELVMAKARQTGARILPVDSEHSAIFQCLMGNDKSEARFIWLTASGGPFRNLSRSDLAKVTPEMALNHPNWEMGPKITVDSATLMNKGLEVIEAHWLFGQSYDSIKVVVHPQSLVHSMVEFQDGSVIAQLGPPDMRLPIAFALSYPKRLKWDVPSLDLAALGALTFELPDEERFPALGLAFAAGRQGGVSPAVLNGANEVAVQSFLSGRLDYLGITACVEDILSQHPGGRAESVTAVSAADDWARLKAEEWVNARAGAAL